MDEVLHDSEKFKIEERGGGRRSHVKHFACEKQKRIFVLCGTKIEKVGGCLKCTCMCDIQKSNFDVRDMGVIQYGVI